MGCKGSKKSFSNFRCLGFKSKRVEQTEIIAFATDIHPARARLNKNAYNRFNIDDFFKADIVGRITYQTPTPSQILTVTPPKVADRTHNIYESHMEDYNSADNSLLKLLTKSMTNLNETGMAKELPSQCDPDVVAISPNNTLKLETPPAFKLPGVCMLEEEQGYDTVPFKTPEFRKKRPKAANRYREPCRLNRPVIPDAPYLRRRGDADEQDEGGDLLDVEDIPNGYDENASQDERVPIDGCSCDASSKDNVCISKHRSQDGPIRVERVRPKAAKGERKIPFFHRVPAPIEPPVPSPDTAEKLVIEDLEWVDVAV